MIYGISAEAPHEFQTPHTIIHKKTYVSPYLKFERDRSSLMNQDQVRNVEPDWTNKVNLQLVEVLRAFNNVGTENSFKPK